MESLRTLLLIFHISAAAVLVGANTGVVRNLRRTVELGKEAFQIAAEDAVRRSKLIRICSVITLSTGVILIIKMGGMAVAPKNFHAALGTMLVAIVISLTLMAPNAKKLLKLADGETPTLSAANPHIKKLAMGQGILHLLWLITLALMFVRF